MLVLDDVHTYYGQSHVLQGMSLTIEQGKIVSLLGRNGVGKTTTLRTIMGLNPPRQGRILYRERPIQGLAPHRIANLGVQLVPRDGVDAEGALLLIRLEDDPDGGAAGDEAGAQQRVALSVTLRRGQLPVRRGEIIGDPTLDDGAGLEDHHHRDRAEHPDHGGEGDHHDADHEARSRGRRSSRRSSRQPPKPLGHPSNYRLK